jgi:inorganic triphosphatase YgiF
MIGSEINFTIVHARSKCVRSYELAATSKEDKDAWLAALSTATEIKVQDAEESLQNSSGYSGVLLKQSGGTKRSKTWASRHFVLEKIEGVDPTLKYYAHAGEVILFVIRL